MPQQEQTSQDPPPPSPPAATPTPGAAPSAKAVFPGGALTLQGAPGTPQELEGLRERREILRDQLSRATNRREELVTQLNETGNPDARTGLQQRLALLDERILQLERDLAATEQLISNAPAEVLAMTREPEVQRVGMDDEAAMMLVFFAFVFGVLLTRFVGRIRRRRRKGSQAAGTLEDSRLDRLSQAVDAIAEEVERIGEGQRFVTQLLAQRRESGGLPADTSSRSN